jgi:hypothetical protein
VQLRVSFFKNEIQVPNPTRELTDRAEFQPVAQTRVAAGTQVQVAAECRGTCIDELFEMGGAYVLDFSDRTVTSHFRAIE